MEPFVCRLADVNIEVHALYPETKIFCSDYLTENAPDISIEILPEDIIEERRRSDITKLQEIGHVVKYPDTYLETLALYRKIANSLLDFNVLLLHGSAISVDNEAYLFIAKSGTGKSTHTRLWRQYFGARAFMVNDDKPLIKITEDKLLVYGTPWDGKHHLSRNVNIPLKAISILERSEQNMIKSISIDEASAAFLRQTYMPEAPEAIIKTLELLDRLMRKVKIYRLGCNMSEDAAIVSYEGMQ